MELKKYKDKSKEYTYYLKGGKEVKHGSHKYWDSNGQILYEDNYKDGELHGLHKYWYDNGQIEREFYYWEGIKYESEEEYIEQKIANKSW